MLNLIFCLVCGYMFMYILFRKKIYTYWKKRNVPYPDPILIFGNIWKIIMLRKTVGHFLLDLYRSFSSHPYVGFFVMSKPAILIRDAELIKNILVKDFDHFQDNWYTVNHKVDPLLACSPFVRKGKEWKQTRSMITPQFTGAKVKTVFPIIKRICDSMTDYIENIKQLRTCECIEVTDLCARFTGESIMQCGYGLEANSFTEDIPETFKVVGATANPLGLIISMKRTFGLLSQLAQQLLNVTFIGNPTPRLFNDIISKEVETRLETNTIRNDFLSYLMELQNKNLFESSHLPGHAFTMFLDGFQTSFAAMAYALLELALNPEVQILARNEVCTVLQNYNFEISYEAIQELTYLENTLFETLRKHPIIKFMARMCNKEYNLHNSTETACLTIEEGTLICISVRGIHYDPEYYPEPDKFDPDRFKEVTERSRPSCSFLGFGEGPRICIGRRFAIAQVVSGLATILLNYELKLNERTIFPIREDYFHISDVPVSGLYIDFIRRPFS